ILSIEGDRIIGRETIPILIGPKGTQGMLLVIAVMISLFMLLSASFGLVSTLGYYLVFSPAYMIMCFYVLQLRKVRMSTLFEAVIDSNFILLGLITWLWQLP
ncbi:MAG: hypothetical protein JSU90_00630, partial [Nitrospiraceae bacterium]